MIGDALEILMRPEAEILFHAGVVVGIGFSFQSLKIAGEARALLVTEGSPADSRE